MLGLIYGIRGNTSPHMSVTYSEGLGGRTAVQSNIESIHLGGVMLERVFNGLLWLDTIFTRSRDPDMEEYRQRQRIVFKSGAVALGTMLLALFVMPLAPDTTGYNAVVAPVQSMFAVFFLSASCLATLTLAWSSYRLWRFCEGYDR